MVGKTLGVLVGFGNSQPSVSAVPSPNVFLVDPCIRSVHCRSVLDVAGAGDGSAGINLEVQREVRLCLLQSQPRLRTLVLTHPDCMAHAPWASHQESPERMHAILGALKGSHFGLEDLLLQEDVPLASPEAITRAHSVEYYDLVVGLGNSVADADDPVPFTPMIQRELRQLPDHKVKREEACDTGFSKGSLQAALRACGAVCEVSWGPIINHPWTLLLCHAPYPCGLGTGVARPAPGMWCLFSPRCPVDSSAGCGQGDQ